MAQRALCIMVDGGHRKIPWRQDKGRLCRQAEGSSGQSSWTTRGGGQGQNKQNKATPFRAQRESSHARDRSHLPVTLYQCIRVQNKQFSIEHDMYRKGINACVLRATVDIA